MSFLELPFMRAAFAASLLAGSALAIVGIFVSARRVAFAGLAVSQLAALGTVLGSLVSLHSGEFAAAFLLGAVGLFLMTRPAEPAALPQESWVGTFYILGAALSVLILSKLPHGETHTLTVFFGNILSLGTLEVWESAGVFALSAGLLAAWWHRWIWLAFDPLSAEISGLRAGLWDAVFVAVFTLSMTVAIHIFGVLLAFAYLLLPASAGFMAARGMRSLAASVLLLAWAATAAGFSLSFRFDFPTGPFVAALLAVCVLALRFWRKWGHPT